MRDGEFTCILFLKREQNRNKAGILFAQLAKKVKKMAKWTRENGKKGDTGAFPAVIAFVTGAMRPEKHRCVKNPTPRHTGPGSKNRPPLAWLCIALPNTGEKNPSIREKIPRSRPLDGYRIERYRKPPAPPGAGL